MFRSQILYCFVKSRLISRHAAICDFLLRQGNIYGFMILPLQKRRRTFFTRRTLQILLIGDLKRKINNSLKFFDAAVFLKN
jgi:hypothetical protein